MRWNHWAKGALRVSDDGLNRYRGGCAGSVGVTPQKGFSSGNCGWRRPRSLHEGTQRRCPTRGEAQRRGEKLPASSTPCPLNTIAPTAACRAVARLLSWVRHGDTALVTGNGNGPLNDRFGSPANRRNQPSLYGRASLILPALLDPCRMSSRG